jgi:hypothetical protein
MEKEYKFNVQQSRHKIHLHNEPYLFSFNFQRAIMNIRPLLFLTFLLSALQVRAQVYEIALEAHTAAAPPGIFVHHDQQEYVPGETIWFKAYIMQDGRPVPGYTNLYVRLLSPQGKEVARKVYPVAGAVANGEIQLPDSLSNGVYHFQIMTTSMLAKGNFQTIFIPVTRSSRLKVGSADPIISFYPEGGQLIAGIPNRVSFQTEMNGIPAALNGQVREKGGMAIVSFKTYRAGLGDFEFTPVAGRTYEAEVDWQGVKKVFSLPTVSLSGVQLRIEDEKDGKSFQLSRVAASATENSVVTVVAEINGHVVYEQEVAFEDYPSVKGHLLTSELPSGILHFTVFDSKKKVLADRLSFIDNREYRKQAEIHIVKSSVNPRSKQELEIKIPGDKEFSGSVAVIQAPAAGGNSIISQYLLSSRLQRSVWQPGWYFLPGNDSSKKALDLLLRTQQLAGMDWREILDNKPRPVKTTSEMISVSGRVMDGLQKETLGPGQLNFYVEAEDSTTFSRDVAVDDKGNFKLEAMEFSGRAKLYYAFTDKNQKPTTAKVLLDPDEKIHMLEGLSFIPLQGIEYEQGTSPDLATRVGQVLNHDEEIKILEKVTLNANKKKRPTDLVDEKYTTGVFRMQASKLLDNINEPSRDGSMSVVDYIRNRVNEVEMGKGGFVNRKTLSMGSATRWAVGIFLDESPTDISILKTVRVADVALVKFFDVGWVGVGSSYPGGAIAVWTKKDAEMAPTSQRLEHVISHGYSLRRNFVHIDYGQKDIRHAPRDHRHTLHWSPDLVVAQGKGNYKFSYYNNDLRQVKRVIVQGFDPDGTMIYAEQVLE